MANTFISRIANFGQYDEKTGDVEWVDNTLSRWKDGAVYNELYSNFDIDNPYSAILIGAKGKILIGQIIGITKLESIRITKVKEYKCSNSDFLKIHALFPELISRVKASFQPFIHPKDLDIDEIVRTINNNNNNLINYYIISNNFDYKTNKINFQNNDRVVIIDNDGLISNVKLFNKGNLVDFPDEKLIQLRVKNLNLKSILEINKKTSKKNNIKCIEDIIKKINNKSNANKFYKFKSFSAYHNAFFNKKLYIKINNVNNNLYQIQQDLNILNPVNLILYGPPGTGKTYSTFEKSLLLIDEDISIDDPSQILKIFNEKIKNGQIIFTTFHQSYGYEEFIEGLKPVLNTVIKDKIQYKIENGIFKAFCKVAKSNPDKKYVIIIDEINRGNISKIFGELISLIETDKREGADNALSVKLPYSKKPFSVPVNVNILGTMNTADRSLALLDTALRRRFNFEALMPDARDVIGAPLHNLRIYKEDLEINIPKLLEKINQRIEALYDRDHCIGHAYFTPLTKYDENGEGADFDDLADIFRNKLFPLLEEYFFQNWKKIRLVLGDNNKPNKDHQFILETVNSDTNLVQLFGDNHGLETHDVKPQFSINEDAFSNPDAYIGIYS